MKKTMQWMAVLTAGFMLIACNATTGEEKAVAPVVSVETEKQEENHDDHAHKTNENAQKIYDGYFDDNQVADRALMDWAGDWQSVYPYLLDGTLDEVFHHKAANNDSMDFDAYKEYYTVGYVTDVNRIIIKENGDVTFYENGHTHTGNYVYDGYEVLTYEKGNRGVRYIYKLAEVTEGMPTYIQFSDHIIAPQQSGHYHLYWGNDRAQLLEEVTNWPTYYPTSMDGHTIAHEMIAH